ncbi:hypothetical protein KUCAC02_032396 [Chaenocephalus aceratus]|nr:hypothetical protein KUCAC02_032396 [Chaenocephalus aceratus]
MAAVSWWIQLDQGVSEPAQSGFSLDWVGSEQQLAASEGRRVLEWRACLRHSVPEPVKARKPATASSMLPGRGEPV